MILIDTSIWIDHLRGNDPIVAALLDVNEVLMHPYVLGEIALGDLPKRRVTLGDMDLLPKAAVADADEALHLIERHELFGSGVGYVDICLLASALMTRNARLWTRDKRLKAIAERLGVAATDVPPSVRS